MTAVKLEGNRRPESRKVLATWKSRNSLLSACGVTAPAHRPAAGAGVAGRGQGLLGRALARGDRRNGKKGVLCDGRLEPGAPLGALKGASPGWGQAGRELLCVAPRCSLSPGAVPSVRLVPVDPHGFKTETLEAPPPHHRIDCASLLAPRWLRAETAPPSWTSPPCPAGRARARVQGRGRRAPLAVETPVSSFRPT